MKSIIVALVGLIGLVYLVNPTAGVIELLPDNIPIVGNLDEATAMGLVIASLRYFGVDLTNLFSRNDPKKDENDNVKKIG